MGFDFSTSRNQLEAYVAERQRRIEQAIIYNLAYIGEQVVNAQRQTTTEQGSYMDRTSNLRSSTGYVIVVDGEIAQISGFEVVKEGVEGSSAGRMFAQQAASQYPKGYVLIVVAGMEYATYVSKNGYNVLDTAHLMAEELIGNLIKDLKKQ